jgi:hypothetical protein
MRRLTNGGESYPTLRPSLRWTRKVDEVRICTVCEHEIVSRIRSRIGEVLSEFVSADGACWECAHVQ